MVLSPLILPLPPSTANHRYKRHHGRRHIFRHTSQGPINAFPEGSLPQFVRLFGRIQPSLYKILLAEMKTDPAAMDTLHGLINALGGGTPTEQQQKAHADAKLPPELEQFTILKETPKVAAALNDPAFVAAQEALQAAPNDATALATLQQCVQPVVAIYKKAIDARVQEEGIKVTCRKVIVVGNGDFE